MVQCVLVVLLDEADVPQAGVYVEGVELSIQMVNL